MSRLFASKKRNGGNENVKRLWQNRECQRKNPAALKSPEDSAEQKTDAERKERAHRLIERGAILESVFRSVIPLSNEEVRAFLSDVSRLPEVRKLLTKGAGYGDTG